MCASVIGNPDPRTERLLAAIFGGGKERGTAPEGAGKREESEEVSGERAIPREG